MKLLTVMLLMTKRSKMNMMEKMTLCKTKDLLVKDIIYMLKRREHQDKIVSDLIFKPIKNQMNSLMVMLLMIKRSKMSMMEKMTSFKMKVLLVRDITYICNKKLISNIITKLWFKQEKNQMSLPMVMLLMTKKFKMNMMVKMTSFKMKVLLVKDITYTFNLMN